jgi:HSP20 family protein
VKIWSVCLNTAIQEQEAAAEQAWRPPVDIYRRGQEWLLKFDLAGVRPSDVQVRIAGSRIAVTGVRRDWIVEEGYSYHSMEISYNRFERLIELPGDFTGAEFSLEARDGLLLVHVRPASWRR